MEQVGFGLGALRRFANTARVSDLLNKRFPAAVKRLAWRLTLPAESGSGVSPLRQRITKGKHVGGVPDCRPGVIIRPCLVDGFFLRSLPIRPVQP
jgi:hypothetical protein